MKPSFAALAAAVAFAAPVAAFAQEDKAPLDERYFKAYYQENGLRDFEKAAALYAEVADAARAAKDAATEAKALLGRGRCLRTLGKTAEAKSAFEAALALEPANDEAKKALATAGTPAAIDDALRDRIGALVNSLSGPQKDQAKQDLLRIGTRSVPVLEEGLRELDIGVVAASAEVLAVMNAPGARGALARAINDPKVTFPRMVAQGIAGIVPWNAEEDPEGRLQLLREVLRIREPRLRTWTFKGLLARGYVPQQAPAVAAVVAEVLAAADDEWKKEILAGTWGTETKVALFPFVRPLLGSSDPVVRAKAIDLFQAAPEKITAEDAAAFRHVLEKGTPAERFSAFRILDGRKMIAEPVRGETFAGLLSCDDDAVVAGALGYLVVQSGQPSRWSDSYAPGFLAGYRKALGGSASDERLQQFARILYLGAGALADEDLIGLVSLCKGLPRNGGVQQTETAASQAVSNRAQRSSDPEVVSSAFLRGFRTLEGAQRAAWIGAGWSNSPNRFTTEVWQALASDTNDGNRNWAYNEFIGRAGRNRIPVTDAILEWVGKDLGNQPTARQAWAMAKAYPAPVLAGAVREQMNRATRDSEIWDYLAVLVKCLGKDAAPDVRERLARDDEFRSNNPSGLLQLLVDCLGKDAVPDVRETLQKRFTPGTRDLLVKLVGVEAVPDLLELAAKLGKADEAVCSRRATTVGEVTTWSWTPAVPQEVMEAFMVKLPKEKRTGPLLEGALGSLRGQFRADIVRESLEFADAAVLVQAALAVRRFNMIDLWPKVVPLLDHSSEAVRTEAQETLDAIRKYRELKATFERFGEGGAGKAFDDAVALAANGEPAKRKAAALALGALGDPAGVAPLLKLVEDGDAAVREAALGALERLGGKR